MAVWSVVSLRQCGTSIRLDAEHYHPEYLTYLKFVSDGDPLEKLVAIFHPKEIKREYTAEGIQILLAQNVRKNRLEFRNTVFMCDSVKPVFRRNLLRYDDVIMTRTGVHFGDAAVYKGQPEEIYACADVLIIRPKGVPGGYISTYFNTRIGRGLLTRGAYGMSQPHIAPNYLYMMRLPRFGDDFEKSIDETTVKAYEKTKESEVLYQKAELLLLQALGLDQLDLSPKTTYTALFSEAFSAGRLDSEYFHPEKEHILEQLAQLTGNRVGDYFHLVEERLNPELGNDKNVYNYDLTGALRYFLDDDIQPTLVSELGSTKVRFQTDDVVVSRLRSYLREIAVVCTPQSAFCVGSSEFYVLRSKGWVTPELLLVYLRSDPVQKILKWCQKGSNHPRFDEREIITLKLPDNILEKQNEVTTLVQNGIEAYREAKRLLEEAKHRVEQMILGEGA
jgi:type I restriction enzyme, S subunit